MREREDLTVRHGHGADGVGGRGRKMAVRARRADEWG